MKKLFLVWVKNKALKRFHEEAKKHFLMRFRLKKYQLYFFKSLTFWKKHFICIILFFSSINLHKKIQWVFSFINKTK